MNDDPALAEAAGRTRFITTIVVGVAILLDVFAAFVGQPVDPDTKLMAILGSAIVVALVFAMPATCFYTTLTAKRAGVERKPMTAGLLLIQAVMPLSGTVPAAVVALVLRLQVLGIAAGVATVLVAALLWPTEKRLDLVVRGEAKVLFPVQNTVSSN